MAASRMTEPADAAVLAEYSQLQMAKKMLEKLKQRTKCFFVRRHRNEAFQPETLFGRWLTLMQLLNEQRADERYRLFLRQPLEDDESRAELERLLLENYVNMTANQAADLVNEQLDMMEQFLRDDGEPAGVEVTFDEDGVAASIAVGDFRTPHCRRIRRLVSEFGLTDTALMVMRYHPLTSFDGGESVFSATAFSALCSTGAATLEGFASPLNCHLLGRPGAKFCSLFEDTDAVFGSSGSFFRIKLTDQPGGGWILNPPFVDPVLVATARKVVQLLEEAGPGRFWFYITFPSWEDNEGWRILDQSEWKVTRMTFPRDTFNFSHCYGTKTFKMHTKLCLFVLGDLPDTVDLAVLRRQLASGVEGPAGRCEF